MKKLGLDPKELKQQIELIKSNIDALHLELNTEKEKIILVQESFNSYDYRNYEEKSHNNDKIVRELEEYVDELELEIKKLKEESIKYVEETKQTNSLIIALKEKMEILIQENSNYKNKNILLEREVEALFEVKNELENKLDEKIEIKQTGDKPVNIEERNEEKDIEDKNIIEENIDNEILKNIIDKISVYSNIRKMDINQWNRVLKFGEKYHLLMNSEIRDIKGIMASLNFDVNITNEMWINIEKILKKLKLKGFDISLLNLDELDDLFLLGKDSETIEPLNYKRISSFLNFYEKNGYLSNDHLRLMFPDFKKIINYFDKNIYSDNKEVMIGEPIKEIENLENKLKINEKNIKELTIEDIKKLTSKDWYEVKRWAKKNHILTRGDYGFLNRMTIFLNSRDLTESEAIRCLEIYVILMDEGFKGISSIIIKKEENSIEYTKLKDQEYKIGDNVELLKGDFIGCVGTVKKIEFDYGEVEVMVNTLNKTTIIKIDLDEVKKIDLDEKNKVELEYKLGDKVKLLAGSFKGEDGEVTTIDLEENIVGVTIFKFGRNIETEVQLNQVEIMDEEDVKKEEIPEGLEDILF